MLIRRALNIRGIGRRCSSSNSLPEMPPTSYTPPPYKGPNMQWIKDIRKTNLSPALFHFYRDPLFLYAGNMQYLFDQNGKRYLDFFGGIVTVSVGHCHPKVQKVLEDQSKLLWHTTNVYHHPGIHEYAHKLAKTLPGDLKNVYFVNSGSEANDLAMMMARLHTRRFDIISLRYSYHGTSMSTMGLTGNSGFKYNFANGLGVHNAMTPDPYQGLWGGYRDSPVQSPRASESEVIDGVCSSADKYVDELNEVITCSVSRDGPAAFIAESIQGVGGMVQYPLGYLKKAFNLVKEKGGVCIADEVQTGFGRTGDNFWAFDGQDAMPDIVTMAKGIGNGIPLAAVVTTPEIAQSVAGLCYFNTFGGSPLCTAVGSAVLDVIESEQTQQNSKKVGTYFLKGLEKLMNDFEIVGDVRGKGLFVGVEFVEDKKSRVPLDREKFIDIWEACRDMGLILGWGPVRSGFRIAPPMCITNDDVDFALAVMRRALEMHGH